MLVPTNPWVSKIGLAAVDAAGLRDQDQPIAGADLAPEADVLHPAEADDAPFGQVDHVAIIAGELGGGLADQDAGHERIVGHVAADPELVGLDVLIADDQVFRRVEVDDRRQLLHLEPLGVGIPRFPFPTVEGRRRRPSGRPSATVRAIEAGRIARTVDPPGRRRRGITAGRIDHRPAIMTCRPGGGKRAHPRPGARTNAT